MPKKRTGRVYWRQRGGARRAYGDFRDFASVLRSDEPARQALIAPGDELATTDPDIAAKLAGDRVKELEERRRGRVIAGVERESTLSTYAARHLKLKARDSEVVDAWLVQAQRHLETACSFFGADVDLAAVSPEDLERYVEHLRRQPNGRTGPDGKPGTLSETSVRKYLNSLSNMYARAVSERYVRTNPVGDMYRKPTEAKAEAPYLSAAEAALLLESARTYKAPVDDGAFPWMYPLLATFLLTGGRKSEVLGLEVDDVSLRLGKVYFRPNEWRRLKTRGSKRTLPLWPQLREILEAYLLERERTGGLGSLLFPSARGKGETMVADVRKALDRIAKRAGFPEGSIRLHQLRHTYTAARLQTCDRGRPVALYTVARELGHRSTNMIEDRYGHLHDRAEEGGAEVVEYRADQYAAELGDRLKMVRSA